MLLLTAVLVLLFLVQFLRDISGGPLPAALPDVPPEFAALLGISHAGYVGNKLPRRTAQ